MVALCAHRRSPCENEWCATGRINLATKKKARGTHGITTLSLRDPHGYTDPHYHFKHQRASTEVDAVAASLECSDQGAASSRRAMRCRLSPKHRLEAH